MKNLNHPLYMNKVWVSTKADKGGTLKEDLKNLCYFGINVVTNGEEIEIKEFELHLFDEKQFQYVQLGLATYPSAYSNSGKNT